MNGNGRMNGTTTLIEADVLIWDFDGTLYPQNDRYGEARFRMEIGLIQARLGVDEQRAKALFDETHAREPSSTASVASLVGLPVGEVASFIESKVDRRNFIAPDPRLHPLFDSLACYRHFLLSNGAREPIERALVHLGLEPSRFEKIVTAETVVRNKPHDDGYRFILKESGARPDRCLAIGDRPHIDLAPARKLGIRTCLVGSMADHPDADVTIRTVYDIANIVIPCDSAVTKKA